MHSSHPLPKDPAPAGAVEFEYGRAFARNLGLVSEAEQARLRRTRVALPGLGAVGGGHLQALARLGIGAFHLADPDTFEVANIHRQLGASMETLGRNKAESLAATAHSINPEIELKVFAEGLTRGNVAAFLAGVDVVVDGIDFFCLEEKRMLYRACRERGIPVVNAGPIGYGAALLVFLPDGISFDEYFRIEDSMTRAEQLLAHVLGLAPGMGSDVDPTRVNFEKQQGPALASACLLCAALAATEALKLVTRRGTPAAAPNGVYFDPYRGRTVPLRPRPSLTRSLRGRVLRYAGFRRFPALRAMHEREAAARSLQAEPMVKMRI